ncbi:MAG: hypothetical protein BGO41_04505 [Clostridiales bacterium 38-18]|nr:MAG: hypothetical protein BGO41_04505 [Clostridiales bacterium 38-18]
MKRLKDLLMHNTLKRKVFSFILVIMLCFLTGFLYTFYVTYKVNQEINQMFTTSILLNEMNTEMDSFETNLESYLASKNSDSFVLYLDLYNKLNDKAKRIEDDESVYSTNLQMQNIGMLLSAYLDVSEDAIEFKRGRNTEGYLASYSQLLKISSYIDLKVSILERMDFKVNLQNYMQLSEQFKDIQLNLVAIVMLLIVLSILFVFTFSKNVTGPIEALSRQAEDIAKGKYDFEPEQGNHFREAELLRDTFYDMASHIQEYINELRDKVETENKLRVSETEKLKMQNSLNQAELMALQSQINPHFLFNTLNAGVQLAIIEDAERTGNFLEVLSKLFRYNIQSLQNKVRLCDEFDNAEKYYELMKVRFKDQFTFKFELDPEVREIEMPPLILQPLLENALIHGFRNKTETGNMMIWAYPDEEAVIIEIWDDGEGIEKDELERLNSGDFRKVSERHGHTTGLGLGNVYDRLKHFFNTDQIMRFESEKDKYTRVIIKLPRKGLNDVESSYSG